MPEFSLSSLDSINQIGIALLLAYLNLERYRYRKKPLELIRDQLQYAVEGSGVNDLKNYDDYKKLTTLLADLKAINSKFYWSKIRKISVNLPNQFVISYFSSNADRFLTIIFCIVLACTLIINVNYYPTLYDFFNQYPAIIFYTTICFSAFPLLNIWMGRQMEKKLLGLAKEHVKAIDKTIKTIKQVNQGAIEDTSPDKIKKLNDN
ncbi:hypothetical protein SPONN_647 [uncultured Candidatus Thioglobus sp.]|nr:hypothetical protein SPONN_647 [uncultured Candidatus Thioglobus sp.]